MQSKEFNFEDQEAEFVWGQLEIIIEAPLQNFI